MSARDDGGPAFPQPMFRDSDGCLSSPWDGHGMGGLSVRDYFAGQALAGIKANSIPGEHHIPEMTVRQAYELADLMLAERVK